MSKKPAIEIETTLGTIQIKKSGFTAEGYPGFVFSINRKGKCVDIALLEVDESDPDEEPVVKIHVWSPGHEDPVFDQWLTAKQIDKMYEEGK